MPAPRKKTKKAKKAKTARTKKARAARKARKAPAPAASSPARSRRAIADKIKTLARAAERARDKGEHEKSRAALERILALDPGNADAVWWMGDYWHTMERPRPALRYYRKYLGLHPGDPEALHMIAALGGRPGRRRASDDYLRTHFDAYAEDFEDSLVGELDYRAPRLLRRALAKVRGPRAEPADIADIGCGTGLVGVEVRGMARTLTGVDLSRKMVALARKRGIYDRLAVAEVTRFLRSHRRRFDMVVSADVLIYFGDITALFRAAAGALRPGGLFAFTAESRRGGTYALTASGRYAHNPAWLARVGRAAGLAERHRASGRLRYEVGRPVAGVISVMEKVG